LASDVFGYSECKWSPNVTKKMHRHENNSKYKTTDKRTEPVLPKASLAISGKEWIAFLILALGFDPGRVGDLNGSSGNMWHGLGSPLSSRPKRIDVLHAMNTTRLLKPRRCVSLWKKSNITSTYLRKKKSTSQQILLPTLQI
jgi:hypothetical protein